MNKFFKIIRRLYTRAVEVFNNIVIRPKLNDEQVLGKFYQLSTQYDQTFSLFSAIGALERGSNGYSWDSWSGKIRSVFLNGVHLAFLSQPLIRFSFYDNQFFRRQSLSFTSFTSIIYFLLFGVILARYFYILI